MHKVTLAEQLRYRFDNTMSKGTPALLAWLGLLSLLLVIAGGLVVWLFGLGPGDEASVGFIEGAWESLMRTLDAGTMGGDAGWKFRIAMFGVTLGGVFIVSTLIGALGAGIESKLEELRKGRSFVVETDHTLILGWSTKVFTLVSELVVANENRKNAVIVVLADRDKVEMEDEIAAKIPDTKNTRVVCRSGNPCDMDDLEIVNPGAARSIVVLNGDAPTSDHPVIKTLLAILNGPYRDDGKKFNIVTELLEERSLDVVRLIGKNEVETVLCDDVISRIMVQTSRQSGLSVVYVELLDFDGAEIYFAEEPKLVGQKFGDILARYEDSTVMGIARKEGDVKVNPPMDTVLRAGDRVIAITEDDDTLIPSAVAPPKVDEALLKAAKPRERKPERILVLGWNRKGPRIIEQLANYVMRDTLVRIAADAEIAEEIAELKPRYGQLAIEFVRTDITLRETLDALDATTFGSVIVLSPEADGDPQASDAQTLVTLINLRDIQDKSGRDLNVVSEMLDEQNRRLAEVTQADDFVVGDKLLSLLMSQVSENKQLMGVFRDLFDSEGSEIYMKPAADYVVMGREIDFYAVLESARRRNEVAIGYRVAKEERNSEKAYGVVTNPKKGDRFTLAPEDKVIVIAED